MSVIINMNEFIAICVYLVSLELLLTHLTARLIFKMRPMKCVEILSIWSAVVDVNNVWIEVWIIILSLSVDVCTMVLLSISVIEVDEVVSSLYRADIVNLVRKNLPFQVVLACQYRYFSLRIDSVPILILEARRSLIVPALDLCFVSPLD